MIRDPSDGSVRARKATIASLKERYGENWGIKPPPEPEKKPYRVLTAEELREHYAKHAIGFTPKNDQLDENQD